jgi:replicative DNA helicase
MSLDLTRDEWGSVIDQIKDRYSRQNTLPTGFSVIDNDVLNGGFEKARLYLFGGTTGAGKSTLLINLIINAITSSIIQTIEEIQKNVYVYITLENTIDESLLRLYCALFSRTSIEVLKEIGAKRDIRKPVTDILEKNNSIIIMKYYPAGSIGINDLQVIVNEVYEEYGKDSIKGLYLDYLDNLKIDKTSEMRHELNSITLSLKTLAIENNFPLITLTQLNRAAYNLSQTGGHDLNLSQMSESMGKTHTSDFVGLMTRDSLDESLVHLKIGKNRSGRSNMSIDFKVDFSRFKFLNAYKVTRERTQESGISSDSGDVHTFVESLPDTGEGFGF